MKIIERYIGSQLIGMVLLVALALLGLDLFFYLINELRFVGTGDYGLSQALVFVALTIPRKIYIMFPWSALIGALLALGNLARNNELVAMRAAAISIHKISLAALKGGLVLITIVIFLGEIVAPATERYAQQIKTRALSNGQTIKTEYGVWARHNYEFVHVDNMIDNTLYNVTKYKLDSELKLQEVITAEQALPQDDRWQLHNISGTRFAGDKTENFVLELLNLPGLVDLGILETSQIKHLERLSIKRLWNTINHRVAHDLNPHSYRIALWTKIFQPITILVMVYLAIPFVFGSLRQASIGLKLLVGVIVGFSFYLVNAIFAQLSVVIDLSPLVAMAIPPLLFLVGGFLLLSKVR